MFDNLSEKLEKALKILKGHGSISEINVAETVKEIRRALIDADVHYKIAKQVTEKIKEKAIGQNVLVSITPGQLMIKIVADELAQLMGSQKQDILLKGDPPIILIAGLQGSGKTTFSAKLANYLKAQGRKPLLVACDVYRPAAVEQLIVLGQSIEIEVYHEKDNLKPLDIAQKALNHARVYGFNPVIIDTAGRLSIDELMMNEIAGLKDELKPSETLFVVDAMTGQDAVNTAKIFNDRLNFDGVVLTKLDGDSRGGAALSIRTIVDKPIKFISTGEKLDSMDVFHPDRMSQRILGMGDVISLVERAQQQFDVEESRRISKKIHKNQFNFNDFLGQIQQIKKMGNFKDLASMIPGVNKLLKDVDIEEDSFKQIESIIHSMTNKEKEQPELINGSRKKRIALGSGTSIPDVNNLVNQFFEMRKMMKTATKLAASGRSLKNFNPLAGR